MNVACYARVSTLDQSLARQVTSTLKFAADLDSNLETSGTPEELAEQIEAGAATSPMHLGDTTLYFDKSTGTNTNRDGYRDLLNDVDAGHYDAVVVHSVSRMSRSIRDLDQTAERIVEENETALHIISENFDLVPGERDPYQDAMFRLLGVFAQLEADIAKQRTKEGIQTRMANEEYHHGPAPLGFEKDDGYLIEADGFDRVCAVLELVDDSALSKRKAARELGTSRRTINRSLDREELYGL
ncbi:resolvase [Haloferax sp. Atlit-10N]|uniref:recombinase family protein n=1 Tax=unclassified Haloferax TaxID=2625095 RepID=UPI000E21CB6A|nr:MULTISPECIES: recombinase family protein [unclassified Haloferax]RDZ39417.1 resolvase [Haloferax sp. Atlit-16N]RDZ53932.1 resolvase [Haloferax sp. Atlit-10N]